MTLWSHPSTPRGEVHLSVIGAPPSTHIFELRLTIPQETLSLRPGKGSSCPKRDLAGTIGERRSRVESGWSARSDLTLPSSVTKTPLYKKNNWNHDTELLRHYLNLHSNL